MIRRSARPVAAGKLVFNLPPNTLKAFGGATTLAASIDYTVQPAADKSGMVVVATGTEPIIQSLVAATGMKALSRSALPAELPVTTVPASTAPMIAYPESGGSKGRIGAVSPSFSCSGKLTEVESMICKDSLLADQDRAMDAAWRDAKNRTPSAFIKQLDGERRKYLARRNACHDSVCVGIVYDEWIAGMYNWTPDDGRQSPF